VLKPKLDLCKSEWLELVFDNRNTKYGAYDLRKHYADNLAKALGFTVLAFVGLFEGYNIYLQHQPQVRIVMVDNEPPIVISDPIIKPPVTAPAHHEIQPPADHSTTRYQTMVATVDPAATNPPTITQLDEDPIGPADHKGDDKSGIINITPVGPAGGGGNPTEDNSIHTLATIEVMPQFPGGEAAWQKFLQKHLHYPPQAIDAGIGGKVLISFIVERDGHLSDIAIVRGVGYGLDEEAQRVMKIAPAWSPGIQNGQKVRVRYMMPFNFQAPTDNN
jgi:periplasmic protein TonB